MVIKKERISIGSDDRTKWRQMEISVEDLNHLNLLYFVKVAFTLDMEK